MDGSPGQNVLRKILSVRQEAEAADGVPPERCLAGALAQAAESAFNMPLIVTECTLQDVSLSEVLEILPEKGLIAVLEGPADSLGVLTMDSAFLASLVEQQTIGCVSKGDPPERRATRTDATLAADWIDLVLRKYEAPLLPTLDAIWSAGYGFSAPIPDPRPLGLMLEDTGYRLFSASVALGEVGREGKLQIALLANGRGPQPQDLPPAAVMPGDEVSADDKEAWTAALQDAVEGSEAELRGVLHRIEIPISEVETLEVGTLLSIPVASIGRVELEAPDGAVLGHARLGQSAGQRALKIVGEPEQPEVPEFAAPSTEGALELGAPANIETSAPELDMPSLPEMPDLTDLPDLPTADGLPDIETSEGLPDIGSGDLPEIDMGDLPAMDDLPDLGDLPDLPDLPPLDASAS